MAERGTPVTDLTLFYFNDAAPDWDHAAEKKLVKTLIERCVLLPYPVDTGAAIEAMRYEGWTCDMHEPDINCEQCTEMITETIKRILGAATGNPGEGYGPRGERP